MSHRSVAPVLLLASTLVACGGASTNTVDIARPDPAPLLRTTAEATAEAPPPSTGWSLFADNPAPAYGPYGQKPPPSMGAPCAGETAVPVFGDVCGTKHRVAVEYDATSWRPFTNPPCQLATFVRKKQPEKTAPSPGANGESVSACVVGQELLAQGETPCPMCRIPQPRGWAFHGRIDEMTGEQNVAIYQRLGLDGVAPATATAWSSIIESSTRKALSSETPPNGQVAKASRGD